MRRWADVALDGARRNPDIVIVGDANVSGTEPGALAVNRPSEHDEQAALFDWAAAMAGEHPELDMLYANPNGGHRHISVAVAMKAEGQKAGIPDICLPVARGRWHALYIELKVKPNRPTSEQLAWIERLRHYGNSAVVCYGMQDAANTIMAYLTQGDGGVA